jgi:uncharacterized membrane protein
MVWHSDYFFGIFWPLYCLAVWLLLWYLLAIVLSGILITSLVSFGHCIVWHSDYSECQKIQWPKDTKEVIRLPDNTIAKRYQRRNQNARPYNGQKISKEVIRMPDNTMAIVWHSDYFFGIFWPLYCLAFWLLLWYLLAIVLSGILITSNVRQYNGQKIPKK